MKGDASVGLLKVTKPKPHKPSRSRRLRRETFSSLRERALSCE
jgi:hypothetical protein